MQDALYCYIEGWFISWKWKIKSFHNLNQHDNISSYWNNSLNIMDVDRTMNAWRRRRVRQTTPSVYRSKRFKGVIYNSESQKNTIFFLYELKIKGAWRSILAHHSVVWCFVHGDRGSLATESHFHPYCWELYYSFLNTTVLLAGNLLLVLPCRLPWNTKYSLHHLLSIQI